MTSGAIRGSHVAVLLTVLVCACALLLPFWSRNDMDEKVGEVPTQAMASHFPTPLQVADFSLMAPDRERADEPTATESLSIQLVAYSPSGSIVPNTSLELMSLTGDTFAILDSGSSGIARWDPPAPLTLMVAARSILDGKHLHGYQLFETTSRTIRIDLVEVSGSSISGIVLSERRPVPHLDVRITQSSRTERLTTAREGEFTVDNLRAGDCYIHVEDEGRTLAFQSVQLGSADHRVIIIHIGGASVDVSIEDPEGFTFDFRNVQLRLIDRDSLADLRICSNSLDNVGKASFGNLEPGEFLLLVQPAEAGPLDATATFAPINTWITVRPGYNYYEFKLQRTPIIELEVVDSSGTPAPPSTFFFRTTAQRAVGAFDAPSRTLRGSHTLVSAPIGPHELVVYCPTVGFAVSTINLIPGQREHRRMELQPTGTSMEVIYPADDPLIFRISLLFPDRSPFMSLVEVTGQAHQGSITSPLKTAMRASMLINNVPPGRYILVMSSILGSIQEQDIQVERGNNVFEFRDEH